MMRETGVCDGFWSFDLSHPSFAECPFSFWTVSQWWWCEMIACDKCSPGCRVSDTTVCHVTGSARKASLHSWDNGAVTSQSERDISNHKLYCTHNSLSFLLGRRTFYFITRSAHFYLWLYGRKEMFYWTMHSTNFIYGYMAYYGYVVSDYYY